jgi:hypothetical protein
MARVSKRRSVVGGTRGRATHFRPGYLKIPQDDVVECVRVLFSLALSQLTAVGASEQLSATATCRPRPGISGR